MLLSTILALIFSAAVYGKESYLTEQTFLDGTDYVTEEAFLKMVQDEMATVMLYNGTDDAQVRQQPNNVCLRDSGVQYTGDGKDAIFDQLSAKEVQSINSFLKLKGTIEYNRYEIPPIGTRRNNNNYAMYYQLLAYPKAKALSYLDNNGPKPDRYARVTVFRGAKRPRDIMIYKVGPLVNETVASNGAATPLLADNEIPWAIRSQTLLDYPLRAMALIGYKLRDLFKATTGGLCYGFDTNLRWNGCGLAKIWAKNERALVSTGDRRVYSVSFYKVQCTGYFYFCEIPFSFKLVEDVDKPEEEWEAYDFHYCYQGSYTSAEALAAAHAAGNLTVCTVDYAAEGDWGTLDAQPPYRQGSEAPEPEFFYPAGPRYAIKAGRGTQKFPLGDGSGFMVSWLDWTFHLSVDSIYGPILRNIKFKGQRIAYEIGFAEFSSSYSHLNSKSEQNYFDTTYEMGTSMSAAKRGAGCGVHAQRLPLLKYQFGIGITVPNQICIFENPYNEALWHYSTDGQPRTALQMRTISTIGNYEYIATATLMPDGVMEMKVELGGYTSTAWAPDPASGQANPETPLFSSRLHTFNNGILHDHLVAVKADLDIAGGRDNAVVTGQVVWNTFENTLGRSKPDWFFYDGIRSMNMSTLKTEGAVDIRNLDMISITSKSKKNAWGSPMGYELQYYPTLWGQVYPPGHKVREATGWADTNLAVTKQKDEEQFCSYNSNFQTSKPVPSMSLNHFKNGENVDGEDLVLWIMVGRQHYPKAEDIPVVSNFGSGFILKPRDLFDSAAFRDLVAVNNQKHACLGTKLARCGSSLT